MVKVFRLPLYTRLETMSTRVSDLYISMTLASIALCLSARPESL